MSDDIGMSPAGHGEGPPSDTAKNTEIPGQSGPGIVRFGQSGHTGLLMIAATTSAASRCFPAVTPE